MAKVITLTGLGIKKRLAGKDKCTPIKVFSRVEDRELVVCKEDIGDEVPSLMGIDNSLRSVEAVDVGAAVLPRKKGRPRGSSPSNPNYATKKGHRARAPAATFCPKEYRYWVAATVGGGKKTRRCRCNAPGNSRFLRNSECE